MRRPLATLLLALAVVVGPLAVAAPAADEAPTTTTTVVRGGDIIPEPNSGREPEDAGDRGGALQTALFIGLVVVVAGAGAALVVQSRKARADRGF